MRTVVVGAGVVGLAIAARLSRSGEVFVIEAEAEAGTHTSSRNSEVIHAGIYYPKDSLKARLCVAGKHALYQYCKDHGVAHSQVGKLMVATNADQVEALEAILAKAAANGVDDLYWLYKSAVAKLEPDVKAEIALFSPSTGIVDSHGLMQSLTGEIEANDGHVVCRTRVKRIDGDGPFKVIVDDGDEYELECDVVVNSAGLWASDVANAIDALDSADVPQTRYARGHYFSYSGKSPFRHLVYPVPAGSGGLGVHATLDMAGATRFGPDVQWIDEVDYSFDEDRLDASVDAIREYFPAIERERLQPSYTGIRPKLYGPGDAPTDFVILGPENHGVANLVNLFGIESPGLTSSLAIADYVGEMLDCR